MKKIIACDKNGLRMFRIVEGKRILMETTDPQEAKWMLDSYDRNLDPGEAYKMSLRDRMN